MPTALLEIPVTLTFVAMCGLVLLPMTAWIGVYRDSIGILRGDGGDAVLLKRMRIHGNFIENAPITALVLAGAELLGLGPVWLWLGLAAFVAGRVVHYVLYDRPSRGIGMLLTTLPAAVWGGWILRTAWL